MTLFNGLVAIEFNFPAIVDTTSLSWERAVLIHQFDDGRGIVKPAPLSVCEVSRHTNSLSAVERAASQI
jgi:hypothetical protein